MSRTKVICFANNKGGSGKSTTCSNVGYALSAMGKRVLLIDGDMQLNLSLSFFDEDKVLELAKGEKNLYQGIKKQEDLESYILPTGYEGLYIIPSSTLMSSIEYELFTKWQRELILKKCMEKIRASGKYDFILLDSPPTLGGWVMNIRCAAEYGIIPEEASPWGLFGLANMFEFTEQVRQIAPSLSVLGVAVTKADERKNYFHQTLDTLKELKDVRLFRQYIRIDSAVEWSQDNSKPVLAYKPSSRSAKEYTELTKEILSYVSR
ncbi:MAG: AAA family ATPase [Clostridia bacterium]|nr:AAA family ATPase [Clostridia bacterium]